MARLPRFDLAGIPQHVIQRGNDRQPCFVAEDDYLQYRQELGEAAKRFGCALHAYVLMTNHVHVLVTPGEAGAVSRMMQALGRRYVACFNARYRRTGTLWEGRFKAGLVDSERYVLTCYRYIELNPVRAGMVVCPQDYRWSSHHRNAYAQHDPLITLHPGYQQLSSDVATRCLRYRTLFDDAIDASVLAEIRVHVQQQRAWGSDRFRAQIEAIVGRTAGVRTRGRPWPSQESGSGK